MKIIKRNGKTVNFDPSKIDKRIRAAAKGLNVDTASLFVKVITSLPTDDLSVSTNQIDGELARIANSMVTTHPDYAKFAASIALTSLYKDTNPSFYDLTVSLDGKNILHPEYINKVKSIGKDIDNIIDLTKDELYDYFAVESLKQVYLLKDNTGKLIERPQYMYLRVATWLADTLDEIKVLYNYLSNQQISAATPIMINSGKFYPQLISCTLIENKEDSRRGIIETMGDICDYSSNAAGIGLCVSNVRSAKTKIKSSGGNAGGLLKYIKMVNENLRFFNQQGRRPGAAAIYVEPWHKDIFDIIHIRSQTGKDELRARDTFLALWCPSRFFEAVENDGDWYLMCPKDIEDAGLPALHKIYGDEFNRVYDKAIELGLGEKIKAQDLWKEIYKAHTETGVPYILSKDNANYKSNQSNIGPLIMSNLCAEIFEVATPDETAQCTLSSMVLKNFVKKVNDKVYFDFEEMRNAVKTTVKMLNRAIDINDYSTEKGRIGGLNQRALAIGVQGLADVFFMFDYVFDSPEARELNKEIFENIYFAAIQGSNELVINGQYEPYKYFKGSPMSEGKFQFDLWGYDQSKLKLGKDKWDELKSSVIKHGICNSLFTAVMPVASSAKITGSNEMVEPQFSNVYNRKVIGGEFTIVSKYVIDDLSALGIWNQHVKDTLIINKGDISKLPYEQYLDLSNQSIVNKVNHLIDKYRTIWNIKQKSIIEMAADRGPFIDQSQSMNIYMANNTISKMTSALLLGHKLGLKTLCYYYKTQAVDSTPTYLAVKLSDMDNKPKITHEVTPERHDFSEMVLPPKPENSYFECEGCSA